MNAYAPFLFVLLSLANHGGEFVRDDTLIAASKFVALPTLIVSFALKQHFFAGLTIGAEKR